MQGQINENIEVVWEPIPNSSQELALDTRCHHTLYHGTRGPGKTAVQIMVYRRRVGLGYGKYWRGIIFDREFKNLDDLVAQSKRFFPLFEDGAKFHASASGYKWVWPTGEELLFRYVKKEEDYNNFHGHEYPFIGWNELTKHPTSALYDKMMSTNRSSFLPEKNTPVKCDARGNKLKNDDGSVIYDTINGKALPNIPLMVFSTTNPSGPGHNWVKDRFIDCAAPGEIIKTEIEVFNPRTQRDEIVVKTQVAIFGSYRENIYLDVQYIAELDLLTAHDSNLRKAWLEGSWDFTAGGAFDDLWDSQIHVLPRFKIPSNWHVDRSFDWGSSHPFSVGWWAEANGEEVTLPDGRKWCPEPGSLIQIAEWYGTNKIGTNKGLRMSGYDIADGICEREKFYLDNKWVLKKPSPGPADNQIDDVREIDVDSIATKMETRGIVWERSDKSKGARMNGLELIRLRLLCAVRGEGPGLYFMNNCIGSIKTIPSLPRDEKNLDDIDTTAEDHAYDMVRYRVLRDRNRFAKSIKTRYVR